MSDQPKYADAELRFHVMSDQRYQALMKSLTQPLEEYQVLSEAVMEWAQASKAATVSPAKTMTRLASAVKVLKQWAAEHEPQDVNEWLTEDE